MKSLRRIIEEVEGAKDKLGTLIDPKIKDLVIGLMFLEIQTIQSCQGHSGYGHGLPYPWVDINPKSAGKLLRIVYWYNIRAYQKNKDTNKAVTWILLPRATIRLRPERKDFSLEELQEGAIDFGIKLQGLKKIPKLYKYLF
jgi:hypothetical protein